jgi:hypothetical protein
VFSPFGNTKNREPHKPTCGYWERGIGLGVTIWARQVERAGVQTVNLAGCRDGRGSKQTAGYHGNNY